MDEPIKPTWTYTPQKYEPARIYDETGCLLATIYNVDDSEANQMAALIAAAPRLLAACKECLHVAERFDGEAYLQLVAAIEAATECEVSE